MVQRQKSDRERLQEIDLQKEREYSRSLEQEVAKLKGGGEVAPVPVEVVDTESERVQVEGQWYPKVKGVLLLPHGFDVNKLPPGTVYRFPEQPPEKVRWTKAHLHALCDKNTNGDLTWLQVEPPFSREVIWNGLRYFLVGGVVNRVPSPVWAVYKQAQADEKSTAPGRDGDQYVIGGPAVYGARKLPTQGPIITEVS